jgi:hypothetical protein
MSLRRLTAALFIVPVFLAVLVLAGCGGGENQPQNGGSQGGDGSGGEKQDEAPRGNASKVKIALGTIISAEPDRRVLILRPTAEVQGGQRMLFKVRDTTEILLNNSPAELTDVKKGQDAQISYVVRKEKNQALEVTIVEGG